MKEKFKRAYIDTARRFAALSTAQRLHVGAIIVKDDRIISIGYNGMPSGWDNECEYKDYMSVDAGGWLDPDEIRERWPHTEEQTRYTSDGQAWPYTARYKLVSKDEVLHAETNAIAKLAKSTESGNNADMFITHAPCIHCAKLIFQSGIRRVFYSEEYRDTAGIDFLSKSGVVIEKVNEEAGSS